MVWEITALISSLTLWELAVPAVEPTGTCRFPVPLQSLDS